MLRRRSSGGVKRSPLLAHEQTIRAWLEKTPDLTIAELCARLAGLGTTTSPAAVSRYLKKLELTRKKRPSARSSNREKTSPKLATNGAVSR